MNPNISRRQFLQLASMLSLSSLSTGRRLAAQTDQTNVLIVVFDAWSAENTSLHGYPRRTMPLLEELAEQAVVYHRHYAGGPWTIPGAASLLTGTYPWTHRAFTAEQMQVTHPKHNIFAPFQQAGYHTSAATHNIFADDYLTQFDKHIDHHPKFSELFLSKRLPFTQLVPRDLEAGALAQIRAFWNPENVNSSLFLGRYIHESIQLLTLANTPQPNFSYYHFYPPHQPYHTRTEFYNNFKDDGVQFPEKSPSVITEGKTKAEMDAARQQYDEFLRYVDSVFYRLFQSMQRAGLRQSTWIVLTSDHGELFERGNIGHEIPAGYESEVHIPLLIFPPDGFSRVDIHTPTSAVDVLPTLLHLTGQPAAEWAEGRVLPPFSDEIPPDRPVYVFHPNRNRAHKPITQGSATIIREQYKLVSTFGIPKMEVASP
ncbi:MAG: sulfatase-like hydrolase/transferase, partial [Anaerolineales bacterium]